MIKAKGVAHGCVATLFYFAQIPSSNPERHPFIRCRTHKNEENVYVMVVSKKVCKLTIILIFALSNKKQQEYGTYTRTNFGNYFELHK